MIILVALHTFPKFYSEISNAPSQELVRDLNEVCRKGWTEKYESRTVEVEEVRGGRIRNENILKL